MRSELDSSDGYEEFCWFAREYPRCYRFHIHGAEHRLQSIHSAMTRVCLGLVDRGMRDGGRAFSIGTSGREVDRIYWDFESLLSQVCVSLDLLARVCTPAFREHAPPNFRRMAKFDAGHPLVVAFANAQRVWVNQVKDYRDCFTHYTPAETLLMVSINYRGPKSGWELRAPIPVNPNIRDIVGFRYSRRRELLRYAISTYRHLMALDKRVVQLLRKEYLAGRFPARRDNLFFVGARKR